MDAPACAGSLIFLGGLQAKCERAATPAPRPCGVRAADSDRRQSGTMENGLRSAPGGGEPPPSRPLRAKPLKSPTPAAGQLDRGEEQDGPSPGRVGMPLVRNVR